MVLKTVCPRWRAWWRWFSVVVLVTVIICAYGSSKIDHRKTLTPEFSSTPCRVVKLSVGETCVPLNPQRIITLYISTAANALALGIKPVASEITSYWRVEDISYLAGKTDGVELLQTTPGQFNLEKMLLLRPNLIIGTSFPLTQASYKHFSQIAPTILLPWNKTSADWKLFLQDVAAVFDKTEVANQLINDYYRRVEELKQKLGDRRQQIRVSVIHLRGGIVTHRKRGFSTQILDDVGLRYPPSSMTDTRYNSRISEEYLPSIDGDILLIVSYPQQDDFLEQLQRKPLWQQLKAVQNNQVYLVNSSVWDANNILAAHAALDDLEKYIVNTP